MKERLTKYSNEPSHKNGVCCTHFLSDECRALGGECAHGCKWEEAAWERHAAYEDTGLTPQEVLSIKFEWCAMMDALNSIGGGYTRLPELAEADRAGRLVVLPCKTRQKELLEQYPTADVDENGVLEVCPALLFASHRGKKGGCSTPNRSCDDCRKEFWGLWAEAALEAKRDGSTSM